MLVLTHGTLNCILKSLQIVILPLKEYVSKVLWKQIYVLQVPKYANTGTGLVYKYCPIDDCSLLT